MNSKKLIIFICCLFLNIKTVTSDANKTTPPAQTPAAPAKAINPLFSGTRGSIGDIATLIKSVPSLILDPMKIVINISSKILKKIGIKRGEAIFKTSLDTMGLTLLNNLFNWYKALDLHMIIQDIIKNNEQLLKTRIAPLLQTTNNSPNFYHTVEIHNQDYDNNLDYTPEQETPENNNINKNNTMITTMNRQITSVLDSLSKENITLICPEIASLLQIAEKYQIIRERATKKWYEKFNSKKEIWQSTKQATNAVASTIFNNEKHIIKHALIKPYNELTGKTKLSDTQGIIFEDILQKFKNTSHNFTGDIKDWFTIESQGLQGINNINKSHSAGLNPLILFFPSTVNTYNDPFNIIYIREALIKQMIYFAIYKIILGAILQAEYSKNNNSILLENILNKNSTNIFNKSTLAIAGKYLNLDSFQWYKEMTILNKSQLHINTQNLLSITPPPVASSPRQTLSTPVANTTQSVTNNNATYQKLIQSEIEKTQVYAQTTIILHKIMASLKGTFNFYNKGSSIIGYNIATNIWQKTGNIPASEIKSNPKQFIQKLFASYINNTYKDFEKTWTATIWNPIISIIKMYSLTGVNIQGTVNKAGMFSTYMQDKGVEFAQWRKDTWDSLKQATGKE